MITKILDSRESLSNETKTLEASLAQIRTDLANERERLSGMEKIVSGSHESRLDETSNTISAIQEELASLQGFSNTIAKDLAASAAKLREGLQNAEGNMASRFEKAVSDLRERAAADRDKEFKNQTEKFRQEMERLTSIEKQLMTFSQNERKLNDEHAEKISSLEKLVPEVRYLSDKVKELQEENKKLAEVVSRNQVQIVEAIDQKTTDRKRLEKSLQGQKAKMAELLKELRK
jgi:chromosome segregation ATPase